MEDLSNLAILFCLQFPFHPDETPHMYSEKIKIQQIKHRDYDKLNVNYN